MPVIGEAFVDVNAKTDDVAGQVTDAFEAAGNEAGGRFSGAFGKIAGGAMIGGGLAAGIAGGLFAIGGTFDDVADTIRVKTGAMGEDLDAMVDSVKSIGQEIPASFEDAANAITILGQKVTTNADLAKPLAEQYLELSRITGTDLTTNVTAASDAFNAWGVTAENQPALLDEMFRAYQNTGVSVDQLAAQVTGAQPTLQAMGFSFERSIALAGTLGKAGVSLGDVMPAMGKAMAQAAKDGVPASQVFSDVIDAIKNAPDSTAAASAAMEVFGAKAGPKLASMVREGKLSYDELLSTMQNGSDTIMGAGADTQDFAEKWEMIKNRVLVGLEPLATRVFSGVASAMDKLGPKVEQFQAWFEQRVVPVLQQVAEWVEAHWPQIAETITDVMNRVSAVIGSVLEVIVALWNTYGASILTYVQEAFEGIRQQIEGVMHIIEGVINTVMAIIHGDWSGAWDGIREIVRGVWELINGIVDQALAAVHLLISGFFTTLGVLWNTAWTGIKDLAKAAWDGIKELAQAGVDAIVDFFRGLPGRVRELLGDLAGAARDVGNALLNGAMDIVSTIGDKVWGAVNAIPGKVRELVGSIASAGAEIGSSLINGIIDGVKALPGLAGDFASAFASAVKDVINTQVIDRINSTLEFSVDTHIPGIGTIHINPPDIPRLHTGGVVPGGRSSEMLAMLQGGEVVFTPDQARYLVGMMNMRQAPDPSFYEGVQVHLHIGNFHGTREGIEHLAATSAQHTARVLGARRARFDLRGNR